MPVKSPQFPMQTFMNERILLRNANNSGNLQVSTGPQAMSTETAVEASELHSPAEK